MTYFREVQLVRCSWIWLPAAVPACIFAYGIYQQIILGRPWGDRPMPDDMLLAAGALMLLLPVWLLNARLITEVRDEELEIRFLLLWPRRLIPFRIIRKVEVRTYRPLAEFRGWGVHWNFVGWTYNVRGNRGVELELSGRDPVLIGSERPEELAAAIQARISVPA